MSKRNLKDLSIEKLLITALVALIILSVLASLNAIIMSGASASSTLECSKGWYVTGYFVPNEIDYRGQKKFISVDGNKMEFLMSFLNEVKTEGWGKTLAGDYVGYYDGSWHFSDKPLDSHDKILKIGTVATDPKIINHGKILTIPALPSPWNMQVFTASDIGPDIKGKHIDIFTGEGAPAKEETFRITDKNNIICLR